MGKTFADYRRDSEQRDLQHIEELLDRPVQWPGSASESVPKTYRDVRQHMLEQAKTRKGEDLQFSDECVIRPLDPDQLGPTRGVSRDPYFAYRAPLRAIGLEVEIFEDDNGEVSCITHLRENYDEHAPVRLRGPRYLADLPEEIEVSVTRHSDRGSIVGSIMRILDWLEKAEKDHEDYQMVNLWARGLSYAGVAAELGLVKNTVQNRITAYCKEHLGLDKPDRSTLAPEVPCVFGCEKSTGECRNPMQAGCRWTLIANEAGSTGPGRERYLGDSAALDRLAHKTSGGVRAAFLADDSSESIEEGEATKGH